MAAFLVWYLFALVIGWISFPLIFRLMPGLSDRGYTLARAFGLIVWGYLFWIMGSLHLVQNNLGGQSVAMLVFLVLVFWLGVYRRTEPLIDWVKQNYAYMLKAELVFLLAFALWSVIRAASPAIIGTEKPMELAFINAILSSPNFPPNDPWLSGYAISYYYFGYVIIAMLIRVTGVTSSVGFNLTLSMWFALISVGGFGVLYNLLALRHKQDEDAAKRKRLSTLAALLAPLLILIVSNAHGALDMLHARGFFAQLDDSGTWQSSFWEKIQLKELNEAPPQPWQWLPERPSGVQWWGASRVLQDFRIDGQAVEVIDEFPNFSFVLGDLHPHVLAVPFTLLIIGFCLNLYNDGMAGGLTLFKRQFGLSKITLAFATLVIMGLVFLNTWDMPVYLSLFCAVYWLKRYQVEGWQPRALLDTLLLGAGMGLCGFIAYLPFFIGFSSQAGGIIPSLVFFTYGRYFWIMFLPMLVPLIIFLVYLVVKNFKTIEIKKGFLAALGFTLGLWVFSWGLSWLAIQMPLTSQFFTCNLGACDMPAGALLWAALLARLKSPGTWLTLLAMMTLILSLMMKKPGEASDSSSAHHQPRQVDWFVLILVLWGVLLTLGVEFVYLRDNFGARMNTIFKFYYQTWLLWSLAAGYVIASLWQRVKNWKIGEDVLFALNAVVFLAGMFITVDPKIQEKLPALQTGWGGLAFGSQVLDWIFAVWAVFTLIWLITLLMRRKWLWAARVVILVSVLVCCAYPVIAINGRTEGFSPYFGFTLDGEDYFRRYYPDEMDAVDFLRQADLGVLVESIPQGGGSYTGYARVSMFSGMPAVLGWVGHELQWRGGAEEIGSRQSDIETLYRTADWGETLQIIQRYNIRYIFVGGLERGTYTVNETKFQENLTVVFMKNDVVIYEVPEFFAQLETLW